MKHRFLSHNSARILQTTLLWLALLALSALACNLTFVSSYFATPTPPPPPTPTFTPVPPPTPTPLPVLVEEETNIPLDPANSGSLCPKHPIYIENGGPPTYIGERDGTSCEGFWTFHLEGIPPTAQIVSATFYPGACRTSGQAFSTTSQINFEIVQIGTLDVEDYGQGGTDMLALGLSNCPSQLDVTPYVQTAIRQGNSLFQIRAYLHIVNVLNGIDDYVSYRTGGASLLTIRYKHYK